MTGLAFRIYQQQAQIILDTANRLASPYDIEIIAIEGINPGLRSVTIREVRLRFNPLQTEHSLQGIHVSFDPREILGGTVREIDIDRIETDPGELTALLDYLALPSDPTDAPAIWSDLTSDLPFSRLAIGHIDIGISASPAQINGIIVTDAEALLGLSVTYEQGYLQADILAGSFVRIGNLVHPALELGMIDLQFGSNTTLALDEQNTVHLHSKEIQLAMPLLRVSAGMIGANVAIDSISGSYRDLTLTPDLKNLSLYSNFSISQVYTSLTSLNLWSARFVQTLALDNNGLTVQSAVSLNDLQLISADLHHDLDLQQGNGNFDIACIDFDTNTKLSDLVSPLPIDADLIDGHLAANGQLNWDLSSTADFLIEGPFVLQAQTLSGYYQDIAFTGLSTGLQAELLPDWQIRTTETCSATLYALDIGIQLSDLSTRYRIDTQSGLISLDQPLAGIFGGTISSNELDYDLTQQQGEFTLELANIDIGQILSLSAYEGVAATGIISGTLPVTVSNLVPVVSSGTLRALSPGGTISYRDGPTATGNQSLDLVYQALQRYQYDVLQARIDYRSDGELVLAIQLEGISPLVGTGQRINLNLNITDNIPALLNSLQAGRSASEALVRQMNW
tara:strand:- start:81357 stop:83222 length:1866 start_codon:yes stop_codon:yes gene_type:complete